MSTNTNTDWQWIDTGWTCFICNSIVQVYTKDNRDGEEEKWCALKGYLGRCPCCGSIGWISVAGDKTAVYCHDEESPHNVACAKAYEAKEKQQ